MMRAGIWLRDRRAGLARRLTSPGRDDRGATAVEYSLIAVFIAALIVAVVSLLGNQVSIDFSSVVGKF